MPLRRRFSALLLGIFLLAGILGSCLAARAQTVSGKALTVERIYSQPSLSARLTRVLACSPDGRALLFQGPTALVWFDLQSQTARTLVSGKAELADPKISPDGKFVSFVREHNVWLVNVADGLERALSQGGTEETRKGELDWVYPEELDIKTAYWWAPDSSAIAYLEM